MVIDTSTGARPCGGIRQPERIDANPRGAIKNPRPIELGWNRPEPDGGWYRGGFRPETTQAGVKHPRIADFGPESGWRIRLSPDMGLKHPLTPDLDPEAGWRLPLTPGERPMAGFRRVS